MSQDRIKSDMAWSTPDRIMVRGYDLAGALLGKINLGDMAFLEIFGRLPTYPESVMFNALAVSLVEHGLTANALATRLTWLGAPESLQSAVAAGLLGLGSRFVGTIEGSAKVLQEAIPDPTVSLDIQDLASKIVDEFLESERPIPGIGHRIHKPQDPRAVRLIEIANAQGFAGPRLDLMKAIAKSASLKLNRVLPVNVTGAIGAIASEMGVPWRVCRGIGIMSRAIGLVGHILEEEEHPLARTVWLRSEAEATSHLYLASENAQREDG
jgi:citrate synthase